MSGLCRRLFRMYLCRMVVSTFCGSGILLVSLNRIHIRFWVCVPGLGELVGISLAEKFQWRHHGRRVRKEG